MAIASNEYFRPKRSAIQPEATVPMNPPIPTHDVIQPNSSGCTLPVGNGLSFVSYFTRAIPIHPIDVENANVLKLADDQNVEKSEIFNKQTNQIVKTHFL